MSRYVDAETMPSGESWDALNDKEKAAVLSFLIKLPTADVEEVKHGMWVFVDGYITCNCCDCQPYRGHKHIDFDNLYKRCPECGARMNKEKEE